MYTSSDLRKGLKIEIDGQPWVITKYDFSKPGKGQSIYKCSLKNMITGSTMDRSYRSNDRFDKPNLAERNFTYLYPDGEEYVFSDDDTYEEVRVRSEDLGFKVNFMVENMECTIEKEIVETEPAVRGDTATNVTKPAKIDSGYEIAVPLFINEGDWVKIDTRTGEYNERINKK